MAVTENSYTGNGSTTNYSFTFPYLKSTDVQVQVDAAVTTAWSFANATTVQFNTAPANGAKIKILRDTNVDSLAATFYAGSSIKSEDLNDNYTQNLYKTQEVGNRYFSNTGGTMTGDLTLAEDVELIFEGATDDAHETKLTVVDPTADRTITLPNVSGTVVTTGDTGTVATGMIADDAINGTKIADDSINSEHYVDGSIDTQHIADSQITTAKIADNQVTGAKMSNGAVDTAQLSDNAVRTTKINDANVTTSKLADSAVTTAKIAAGAVTNPKLAASAVSTPNLASGAVTNDKVNANAAIAGSKLADGGISTAKIADDAVTGAKLANDIAITTTGNANFSSNVTFTGNSYNAVWNKANSQLEFQDWGKAAFGNSGDLIIYHDGNHSQIRDVGQGNLSLGGSAINLHNGAGNETMLTAIADGAVSLYHNNSKKFETTAAGATVTGTLTADLADDSIDSKHYVDGSIDTAHLGNTQVTDAKLASNSVTTSKITDANVTTAKVADSNITLAKLASDLKQTTISDSDTQLPTSGAVVDYVAAQIAPLGGLEVVATEVAFPNTQPASGVVISISDAGGVVVNGSGVSTTGRTVGGSTVTINGFPSSLQSSTLAAGIGLLVSSTGSSQTYNYHKILGKEADITALSDDINDFNNRYRTGGSAPTSSLDNGDLWFDTTNGKMMVYNGANTAWEEVSAVGSFNINTLSSSGSTGGGSATFNGTAYRFTLSNPPQDAQQLLVSINGVIQKPNSGSSQPSEGFAISGNDIIFSAAPNSGAPFFIVTLGQSVQIGAPSDGSVTTAKLTSGAVTTAKIADDAVTGDKIATNLDLPDNNKIRFGTGNDLQIYHASNIDKIESNGAGLHIRQINNGDVHIHAGANSGASNNRIVGRSAGAAELYYDGSKKFDTVSGGARIFGYLSMQGSGGHIYLPDSAELKIGNSEDLRIYHDGTNSWINESGTGSIKVLTNKLELLNAANNEYMVVATENAAVELYYDNSKKFSTDSNGFYCPNNGDYIAVSSNGQTASGRFGYHDNYKLYIENVRGTHTKLILDNDGKIRSQISDGSNLHDRFEVNASGAKVSGDIVPDADGTRNIGSNSVRWNRIYADTIQTLDSVAATQANAEFRNTHSVYGGGVRFKSNNTYGTLELTNTDATDAATLINTTGGWHWNKNLILAQDIAFNGETADANALDDYEEGTWSPGIDRNASSMSVSYSHSTGTYTKIGRLVMVWFDFQVSSGGTSGGGAYYITELPFTALYGSGGGSNNGGYGAPTFRDASLTHGDFRIYGSSSYISHRQIYLQHYNSSGSTVATTCNGSGRITGQAFYFAA